MSAVARKTRQREAIRDAIARARVPVSPREILDGASEEVDGLGLATVYRTLKLLVESGEILIVDIPGDTPRYELSGKGHHHHFVCKGCGKVFELEGCCGHFAELTPRGFVLEAHDVTLFGKCSACAKLVRGAQGGKATKDACGDGHCDHSEHDSHGHAHSHAGSSEDNREVFGAKRHGARAKKRT